MIRQPGFLSILLSVGMAVAAAQIPYGPADMAELQAPPPPMGQPRPPMDRGGPMHDRGPMERGGGP